MDEDDNDDLDERPLVFQVVSRNQVGSPSLPFFGPDRDQMSQMIMMVMAVVVNSDCHDDHSKDDHHEHCD